MPRGVSRIDEGQLQRRLWSPATLRPFAWWDASDLSTVTTVSGKVSEWRDKSGNGYTVSQTTDANRPTLRENGWNGLPVFDFAASWLNVASASSWIFMHSAPSTTVFLGQFGTVADPNNVYTIFGSNTGGSNQIGFALIWDDRASISRNNLILNWVTAGSGSSFIRVVNELTNNAAPPNTPIITTHLLNPTASPVANRSLLYVNGSSFARTNTDTGTASTANSTGTPQIGAVGNGTLPFTGVMAELLVFDRELPASEIEDVWGYLIWKWDLRTLVPASNSFVNRPSLIGD